MKKFGAILISLILAFAIVSCDRSITYTETTASNSTSASSLTTTLTSTNSTTIPLTETVTTSSTTAVDLNDKSSLELYNILNIWLGQMSELIDHSNTQIITNIFSLRDWSQSLEAYTDHSFSANINIDWENEYQLVDDFMTPPSSIHRGEDGQLYFYNGGYEKFRAFLPGTFQEKYNWSFRFIDLKMYSELSSAWTYYAEDGFICFDIPLSDFSNPYANYISQFLNASPIIEHHGMYLHIKYRIDIPNQIVDVSATLCHIFTGNPDAYYQDIGNEVIIHYNVPIEIVEFDDLLYPIVGPMLVEDIVEEFNYTDEISGYAASVVNGYYKVYFEEGTYQVSFDNLDQYFLEWFNVFVDMQYPPLDQTSGIFQVTEAGYLYVLVCSTQSEYFTMTFTKLE